MVQVTPGRATLGLRTAAASQVAGEMSQGIGRCPKIDILDTSAALGPQWGS